MRNTAGTGAHERDARVVVREKDPAGNQAVDMGCVRFVPVHEAEVVPAEVIGDHVDHYRGPRPSRAAVTRRRGCQHDWNYEHRHPGACLLDPQRARCYFPTFERIFKKIIGALIKKGEIVTMVRAAAAAAARVLSHEMIEAAAITIEGPSGSRPRAVPPRVTRAALQHPASFFLACSGGGKAP